MFTFKHAYVSKAKHAAGTAAAHINYISRPGATCYQEAFGVESKPGQTAAQTAWRLVTDRETEIRKNGRILDKFIIALPREMTQEQAIHTVRRFGRSVATLWDCDNKRLMKASYLFTLQDWDSHNPHCHFVLIDADQKTGERVFGTTRKGSTERLRKAWEEACNGELERHGLEARIDRRPQHVIEAEKAAESEQNEAPVSHQREATPALESVERQTDLPPDAPTGQLAEPAEQAHAHEPEQEQDMANSATRIAGIEDAEPEDVGRISGGVRPVSVVARVRGAYQLGKRVRELRNERSALATALQWREVAEHRSQVAADTASRLAVQKAAFEQQHTHYVQDGKPALKGFAVPKWSILPKAVRGWQSSKRKEAVAAQEKVDEVRIEYEAHELNARNAARVAQEQARHTAAIAAQVDGYAWMNPDQQRQALNDMQRAEQSIENTVQAELEPVTVAALYEAYKAGEITADEALSVCAAKGFTACAEQIEHDVAQEHEEGLEAE